MQKYKFYFELRVEIRKKVIFKKKKNGFIYRGQLTSETRTADWRN